MWGEIEFTNPFSGESAEAPELRFVERALFDGSQWLGRWALEARQACKFGPGANSRRETETVETAAQGLGGRVTCLGLYPWPMGWWPLSPEVQAKVDRGEILF